MELIDNINRLLGDDLKQTLRPGSRLKIAASCFSMYAFEALKAELEVIDELEFIFISPTFVANEVTDKIRKERKEFHIPKLDRERSLYGSEFEIQLRNKLTQRAVAKECADWIRRKAVFRSNRTKAPMQQFACVQASEADTAYFATNWLPATTARSSLPLGIDMAVLYEALLQRLLPLRARPQETLADLIARVEQVAAKRRAIEKVQARMAREKQFNRRVEINGELRKLRNELEQLAGREGT